MTQFWILIIVLAIGSNVFAAPQADTLFNYQGELKDGGDLANGSFNLDFSLWDAGVNGNQIGLTQMFNGQPVIEGRFSVELDFGAAAFDNAERWLEISVNGNELSPRQPVVRTPYAIQTRGIMVDANKNVGVGTTAPEDSVHVRKQTTSPNAPERMLIVDSHDDPNNFNLELGSGAGLLFKVPYQNDSQIGAAIDAVRTTNVELNSSTALSFSTSENDEILQEALRIDPLGNVGIGTDTPGNRLHVYENTAGFAGVDVETAANGKPFYGYSAGSSLDTFHYFDGDDNEWRLWYNGNDRLRVRPGEILGPIVEVYNARFFAPNFVAGGAGVTTFSDMDVNGDLQVSGTLSKSAGSFQIDHPLDPKNKYLSHSFVESPDMKNIYDGVIITNESGLATVELPSYFQALNRDYRYQLTVLGEFAQAIVSQKINNNQFVIRTDKPGIEVSWQVTGIRDDAYARSNPIVVEEFKSDEERGYYLNPESFGVSRDQSIGMRRHDRSTSPVSETANRTTLESANK